MNNPTTLPLIISRLSKITDTDEATAQSFVHDFFSLIKESLAEGESVKIKKIGTFTCVNDSLNKAKITFIPDSSITDAINLPFSMFEAVELADDITEEELASVGQSDNKVQTENTAIEIDEVVEIRAEEKDEKEEFSAAFPLQNQADETSHNNDTTFIESVSPVETNPTIPSESSTDEISEEIKDTEDEIIQDESPTDNNSDNDESSEDRDPNDNVPHHKMQWIYTTLGLAAGIIIGAFMGYLITDYYWQNAVYIADDDTESNIVNPSDSIATSIPEESTLKDNAPLSNSTAETEAIVYDTITPNRFLATMSREYYGRMEYWVYIYLANDSILGNPDRVTPGTRVAIPPLSHYATEKTDSANIANATRIAAEIYKRYK